MLGFLRVVIPGLQTQPGIDAGALRQEVVKEQLLKSEQPKSKDSLPTDKGVTETSSSSQPSTE